MSAVENKCLLRSRLFSCGYDTLYSEEGGASRGAIAKKQKKEYNEEQKREKIGWKDGIFAMKTEKLALITGGSGGLGKNLAMELAKRGYRPVLAGRSKSRLQAAAARCGGEIFVCDLSKEEECRRIYEAFRHRPVRVLINCAGFGVYGSFAVTSLDEEMEMAAVNCRAVHMLTKLFLSDLEKRGGAVLNVASSAGLVPGGPYMAAYYAAKAYVVSLTLGIAEELRARKSRVYLGVFCPGPVDTGFFERAGIRAAVRGAQPEKMARMAIRGMEKGKKLIVPGISNAAACLAARLLPSDLILAVNRRIQQKKGAETGESGGRRGGERISEARDGEDIEERGEG